jgi:hypothetical protein
MLYKEIIAVCSEIHAKHINAMWEKQFLNAKAGGTVHGVSLGLQKVKALSHKYFYVEQ